MGTTNQNLFEFVPVSDRHLFSANALPTGRVLIGRAANCDVQVQSNSVSAIHAVFEIGAQGAKIYDMNSTNGTFVNGEKVVTSEVNEGDTIKLGEYTITFGKYSSSPALPPVLDTLKPIGGQAAVLPNQPSPNLPEVPATVKSSDSSAYDIPEVIYPLASDPKAEYSEYIFEDQGSLYPIFKYSMGKEAIEIVILHQGEIFSVDYVPVKKGQFKLSGSNPKKNESLFPYLPKNDSVSFLEMSSNSCTVQKIQGFKTFHLSDNQIFENESFVNIAAGDIVKQTSGDLEIYVRTVSAPPAVKNPPIFRRDDDLKKYIIYLFLLIAIPIGAIMTLVEDEDKEKKKEKAPERIAKILYKPKAYKPPKDPVKPVKKPTPKPKKKVAVKPVKKPTPKPKPKTSPKPKPPGVKTAPKKQIVKKAKNTPAKVKRSTPKVAKKPGATKKSSNVPKARTRFSTTPLKSKGPVSVYKNNNFKSTISTIMAKGGSLSGSRAVRLNTGSTSVGGANIGGSTTSSLAKANVATDVGSLTGSTSGKIDTSRGAEGLSAKKGILTAGIPSSTEVLGSMDPDLIRKILRDNIPQFRYCYQRELENRTSLKGVVNMNFVIGASGNVSRAGVSGGSMPSGVKRCLVGVLKGIQFPRPLGGGKVEVKQPMNFYAKR